MSAGIGTVGFVGLGNMGSALAGNLVKWGLPVVAHDAAGPERSPAGAAWAGSLAELARRADLVVLSLPDGSASESVARAIAATAGRKVRHVVDTSTIGIQAAESAMARGRCRGLALAPASAGPMMAAIENETPSSPRPKSIAAVDCGRRSPTRLPRIMTAVAQVSALAMPRRSIQCPIG